MALEIRPADKLKIIIIEYIISKYPGVIIGNEVMYGTTRKVVDLLALYKGETFAIEVKSERDNIRRLPDQLKEYSLIFDHTIVFTDTKHLKSILSLNFSKVTIFEIIDNNIKPIKLSKEINRTTKQEMLYSVSSSFLKRKFQLSNHFDSDFIRRKIMRENRKEVIHSLLYSFFEDKLKEGFELFLKNGNCGFTADDIYVLSSRLKL